MDILFLSVSAGGGHAKAAEAIMNHAAEKYPGSRFLIVDTVKYVNKVLDKLVIGSYLNSLRTAPIIFEKIYNMAETGENIQEFSETLNRLFSIKIGSLVNEFKPDAIICTHPFPLQMLSILRKRGKVNMPVVGILTDFTYHPFWMYDYIDAYVVAHEYMKYEIAKKGIDPNIIYPFGLPVSSSFFKKNDKASLMKEFGLDADRLTIMLMGGSLGFGAVRTIYKALLRNIPDIQLIVLTGHNKKLGEKLKAATPEDKKNTLILGFTDRVNDLMDVSDFLITKPGGMTIAEALIKAIPLVIMSPLPGQEKRNEQFLVNIGAAVSIDESNIDSVLYQITQNPLRIRHMREMAHYLAKPDAVKDIVSLVEKLVAQKNLLIPTSRF